MTSIDNNQSADKKKILILEDDKFLLSLYADKFISNGFDVYTADNGIDALKIFDKVKPDVVIVDLNVPKLNGLETLKIMQSEKNNTCFIVFTNYDKDIFDEEEQAEIDKLVDNYLLKIDTTPDELLEYIKQLCHKDNFSSK